MTVKELVASPFGIKFNIVHDTDNRGGVLHIYKPQFISVPIKDDAEISVFKGGNRARVDTPAIVINLDLSDGTTHCTVFQPDGIL